MHVSCKDDWRSIAQAEVEEFERKQSTRGRAIVIGVGQGLLVGLAAGALVLLAVIGFEIDRHYLNWQIGRGQ